MLRAKKGQVWVDPIFDSDYYNAESQLIKIPDSSKDRCDQGIVKYLGEECDPSITIGSHVIFSGYTGSTVRIDNEILIVLNHRYVKAIVDIDNYVVEGLYFRGKVDGKVVEEEIENILTYTQEVFRPGYKKEKLLRLFAKILEDNLIPATYETSVELVRDAARRRTESLDIKKEEHIEQRDEFDLENA